MRATPHSQPGGRWRTDAAIAVAALAWMTLVPIAEILGRIMLGRGIENAPVLVQHLGLVFAMAGALVAERTGHLASLAGGLGQPADEAPGGWRPFVVRTLTSFVCGILVWASWRVVESEMQAPRALAYGLPAWWVQSAMPIGFAMLGLHIGARGRRPATAGWALGAGATFAGLMVARSLDGTALPAWPMLVAMLAILLAGAPVFAVIGGVALALFWQDGQPVAAVALSHYQITVNPSLPALPLFTLAGLIFARTAAASRLGTVFIALFGSGLTGTLVAAALMCSFFTAFTGGSGVTILALGGLLLPLLTSAGLPERRGIGLVTSASALGVLLAPSVPLIMYAILARVPINTMFLAGVVPALVMIAFLLVVGGYLRPGRKGSAAIPTAATAPRPPIATAFWAAKWELAAPIVAIGSLVSGLATPTECAAISVAYAALTQSLAHRELDLRTLRDCAVDTAQVIGGVMLILGMALGLTNYLVDAGIPDAAITWVRQVVPDKFVFLLALNVFLFAAGALMEIFAALAVLVPLLLPVATSYGIDPVHFGVIFLANMEMGFLCPPAGMNVYFASSMFRRSVREVGVAVLPAVAAIFLGTLVISWLPVLATGLPAWWAGSGP